MYFDQKCMNKCNCKFNIYSMDKTKLSAQAAELAASASSARAFIENVLAKNYKNIQPALSKYLDKEQELHEEFSQLVKKIAIQKLKCDKSCVNDCLHHEYISFWEIPQCISQCRCENNMIQIEGGSLNLPKLMHYNEYDLKSWAYFKLHGMQDLFQWISHLMSDYYNWDFKN